MRNPSRKGRGLDAEQEARAGVFVANVPWKFARTVPEHPHEYCLEAWLSPGLRTAFDWFTDVIVRYGYTDRFWGQDWTYLDLGDGFKYWESETLDKTGRIINRTRTRQSGTQSARCRGPASPA
jgi:hypothetical protein